MKRSVQEIVELLVFGLIALLLGTALLWLVGWVFDLVGVLFKFFAALIWGLLRFIVPVAVVAAIVYGLVRIFQERRGQRVAAETASSSTPAPTTPAGPSIAPEHREPAPEDATEHPAKPHASEVWAPPQPSPPAAPASDESTPEPGDVGASEETGATAPDQDEIWEVDRPVVDGDETTEGVTPPAADAADDEPDVPVSDLIDEETREGSRPTERADGKAYEDEDDEDAADEDAGDDHRW